MNQERGKTRYENMGMITCYMNSILHILQQIPLFSKYIYSCDYMDLLKEKENKVIYQLYKLIKIFMENDHVVIKPLGLKKVIGLKNDMWNEHKQQDSQEFLNFLISTMEEEIGQNIVYVPNGSDKQRTDYKIMLGINAYMSYNKKEYSILKELFNGLIINNKKCCYCYNNSYSLETFTTLQLEIPNIDRIITLDNCLEHYIKDDILDDKNRLTCSLCGIKNNSNTKTLLWKLPTILILQIKRFICDDNNIFIKKNNKIYYPYRNLEMKPYIHKDSPEKNTTYDLVGVNIHRSLRMNSIEVGHYTSCVKNQFNGNWYIYDDDKLPEEVDDVQNQNAYLLFYSQKSTM